MRNDRVLADFYRIFRILCCCERIRNYKRIGTGNCIRDCYCIPLISGDRRYHAATHSCCCKNLRCFFQDFFSSFSSAFRLISISALFVNVPSILLWLVYRHRCVFFCTPSDQLPARFCKSICRQRCRFGILQIHGRCGTCRTFLFSDFKSREHPGKTTPLSAFFEKRP